LAGKELQRLRARFDLTELTGEQLRQFRKRLGLTQEKLGIEVDASQETVSRWERGKLPIPRGAELNILWIADRYL
jgi:transcriptional regulator with XRE-family HTH domain